MKNILLLEDDKSLRRGISFKLINEGYKVFSTDSIKEALILFENNTIDLIITDIGLEDGSGFEFCASIRKISDVYIIILTALDEEVDIVTGYDFGADDYITKPFSLMVLISKVNALMRRVERVSLGETIVSGNISYNLEEMKVLKDNTYINLSKNELKLLKQLMLNSRQIISKQQLLESLWDIDSNFVDENTLAVNIRRLREKIEDNPKQPIYIKNIRGIGYVWNRECSKTNDIFKRRTFF